jgi:regulator of sigma E protease
MALFELASQAVNFIIPLTILLGLLIFVHELGHFSVAKYFGVRVETFSIGFGKKIWQRTKGDTTYCLSLIPFGGYVKMYGDDPTADIPEEEKKFSFLHKPVSQRIAVVLAGPLMNFFFAILVFMVIAMVGEEKPVAVIGSVQTDSKADIMGFQAGDQILSVNAKEVKLWEEAQEIIEDNKDNKIAVEVKRYATGEVIKLEGDTKIIKNPNILSSKDFVGNIEGLSPMPIASAVGVSNPESPAYKAGLRTGNIIVGINGEEVERWYELTAKVEAAIGSTESLTLKVKEKPQAKSKTITIDLGDDIKNQADLGLERLDLFVGRVVEESAAAKAGLKANDHIIAMNDKLLKNWNDLVAEVRSYEETKKPIAVKLVREGETQVLNMEPTPIVQNDPITGKEKTVYAIGITTSLMGARPLLTNVRTSNLFKAVQSGIKASYEWSITTVLSFWKLLSNEVSAKSIGGPIMIGQLASQSFQIGLSAFLKIMGIISINLFILNLLPLPVLDGGHLLFYTIEAIRGKPVSMRVLEVAQTFGLILLLSLMIFATFNDITRAFS